MKARVGIIILAAGRGRRFCADARVSKVVTPLLGVPLVRAVAKTALASRAISVAVVTSPTHVEVDDALRGLAVRIIRNPDAATDMAGSLQTGLADLPLEADGLLVMLADMPLVRTETIDRLIARFAERSATLDAVVPVYEGRRGNPVLLGRSLFGAIRALQGDEGARALLRKPDLRVDPCAVDDPGITIDIDTTADLEALNRVS